MNNLTVVSQNGMLLVSSRDVAEMTNVRHADLLERIYGYAKHLENGNFDPFDFFVGSTYIDGKGETRPCYLLTRKGCDMVANKMTGEKGVLFTAAYVTKFEEMEKQIHQVYIPKTLPEALRMAAELAERNEALLLENAHKNLIIGEMEPKARYADQILTSKATMTTTQIAKDYGLSANQLNKIMHEEKIQYKVNRQWVLYQKYADEGYTKSETIEIVRSNGEQDVVLATRWTQKGRLFIHEILAKRGIVPYMDRAV